MMNSDDNLTGPVNIGNPEEYKILDLASLIIKLTGSDSRIVHLALPEDDPKQRQPDISLAKEMLNWSPAIRLETGLTRTIDYFKKDLNI